MKVFHIALLATTLMTSLASAPASAQLSIGISVRVGPPPLPIYAQPPLPGPDYLWVPGYWAWDDDAYAYFWVPGTWARAPRPGLLWTPPWWGWQDGAYLFHSGYWGPHIGFYGGIAYGFGYGGFGYQGGYWNGGHVFYNRTVNNVTNVNVPNVYNQTVVNNQVNRVSYNGGPAGVRAQPTPEERSFAGEPHLAATGNQQQHFAAARANPNAFFSANRGRPPLTATQRPMTAGGAPGGDGRPHGNAGPGSMPGQPRGFTGDRPSAGFAPGGSPRRPDGQPMPRSGNAPDDRGFDGDPAMRSAPHVPHVDAGGRPPQPQGQPHAQPEPHPQPQQHRPPPHPPQHHQQSHRPAPPHEHRE